MPGYYHKLITTITFQIPPNHYHVSHSGLDIVYLELVTAEYG